MDNLQASTVGSDESRQLARWIEDVQTLLSGAGAGLELRTQLAALKLSGGQPGAALALLLRRLDEHPHWSDAQRNETQRPLAAAAASLVLAAWWAAPVRAGCPQCGETVVECGWQGVCARGSAAMPAGHGARTLTLTGLLSEEPDEPGLGPSVWATRHLWEQRLALWSWLRCSCGHAGWLPGFVSFEGATGEALTPAELK